MENMVLFVYINFIMFGEEMFFKILLFFSIFFTVRQILVKILSKKILKKLKNK